MLNNKKSIARVSLNKWKINNFVEGSVKNLISQFKGPLNKLGKSIELTLTV